MDIINMITTSVDKLSLISDGFAKDGFKKKHQKRKKFYSLLHGYINSPGKKNPADFFDWYIERLDERMKTESQFSRAYYKVSKSKNEPGFRSFLNDCASRSYENNDFMSIIKPWIPEDEYRIISSSTLSNISEVLELAMGMCDEKEGTQKQVHGAFFSNIPTIFIGVFFHWIIFSFIYESFVTPGFSDGKQWEELSMLEQNYLRYEWVISNYMYVLGGIFAVIMFLSWSIKNWTKNGVFIRENYIDFFPPYSLVKLNNQYSTFMLLANFMRSGKSFSESLELVKEGATPYVQYQVDKILDNSTVQAHVAINTLYFGEYGCDIRDRANNISLEKAISDLLPGMLESKTSKFDRIVKVSTAVSFKPLIYGSLAAGIVPLFISIFESLPKT